MCLGGGGKGSPMMGPYRVEVVGGRRVVVGREEGSQRGAVEDRGGGEVAGVGWGERGCGGGDGKSDGGNGGGGHGGGWWWWW